MSFLFAKTNSFSFLSHFTDENEPWRPLGKIGEIISAEADTILVMDDEQVAPFASVERVAFPPGGAVSPSLLITRTHVTSSTIHVGPGIVIAAGVFLEAGAIIKAPTLIGQGAEIRQGAYIRGGVIVGKECVIGHVTEMKNSVIMDRSAAGHFAYIGDAIIGARVNLGAGVKIANLEFRSRDLIDQGAFGNVVARKNGAAIDTGRGKLGAIVGDYTEIGCNTVISPGAVVGAECWIMPNVTVPKEFYPPHSLLRSGRGGRLETINRA